MVDDAEVHRSVGGLLGNAGRPACTICAGPQDPAMAATAAGARALSHSVRRHRRRIDNPARRRSLRQASQSPALRFQRSNWSCHSPVLGRGQPPHDRWSQEVDTAVHWRCDPQHNSEQGPLRSKPVTPAGFLESWRGYRAAPVRAFSCASLTRH
jgi:hypothetical protein